jgi:hypothetical protein
MPDATELIHDPLECCPFPFALRLALELESSAIPHGPADVREPKEVERLRLTLAASVPITGCKAAELDQARLLRVQI